MSSVIPTLADQFGKSLPRGTFLAATGFVLVTTRQKAARTKLEEITCLMF